MATQLSYNIGSIELQNTAEQFWKGVDLTLREVFNASPDLAVQYRKELEASSEEERLFTYHANPLQIAADLTLTRNPSVEQVRLYERVVVPQLKNYTTRVRENPTEFRFSLEPTRGRTSLSPSKKRSILSRIRRAVRRKSRKDVA